MLNPPLATLSNELLAGIVHHLADTLEGTQDLLSLCLADRAFTALCQEKIFESFTCTTGREPPWLEVVDDFRQALKMNSRASGWVREIRVEVFGLNAVKKSPLYHPKFISLLEELCNSGRPPQRLFLDSLVKRKRLFDKPDLVLNVLQRFLASSLTTLSLLRCSNVPITLFLAFPNLKRVSLNEILPPSRESEPGSIQLGSPPCITHLDYVDSCPFIDELLENRPESVEASISWSNLRCLTVCPSETAELVHVQTILNQAASLEILSFTVVKYMREETYVSFPSLIDLRPLVRLRTLEALIQIIFDNEESRRAAEDLAQLLDGIPAKNNLSYLLLKFNVTGLYPFPELHAQKWYLLVKQILRIAGDDPLELEISCSIMLPENHSDQEVEGHGDFYAFLHEQMNPLWNTSTVKVTFDMYPPPPSQYSV
ncbi:hypothetical protein BKA70DRAFT_1419417 [Coprinopsis sp. MPI-PUGE-AT-0042]|nr:hypothetical protein BKA70DRAFT_1419417 [Coprinopsis sp. MPI-PUGE-AT-0042]